MGKNIAEYELYVLEYARSKDQPVGSLLMGADHKKLIDLPFAFALARNSERVVLIDTGFMKEGRGEELAEKFQIPTWISPLRLLEEVGVTPESVTDIFITHAHYDHMGSIDQFPNATIHIQKEELLSWVEMMALPKRFGFLTIALDPDDIHAALHAAEEHRLHLLEGDGENVVPGIHVRLGANSHTMGHQYVAIETSQGRHVISGDCIYSYTNLQGLNNDGVYVPLGFGVGSTREGLKVMDRLHTEVNGDLNKIVILHDFDRWARFPIHKEIDGFRIARVA